jgi:hypothetical protein
MLGTRTEMGTGGRATGAKLITQPSYNAEVENEWIYTSLTPTCLRDVDRDHCTSSLACTL